VVAFDLPINDLIPPDMPLDSFRLEPDSSTQNMRTASGQRGRRERIDLL
jgi:two-component system sensor histidine kinase RcsD